MENIIKLGASATKYLNSADHLLTQTYPLVKDPKLFIGITKNLSNALNCAMDAILEYDRAFKRISPYPKEFMSRFNTFKLKSARIHKFNPDIVSLILELDAIANEHKQSPVEFIRKDMFVICNDHYSMKTLSLKELTEYLNKTKLFIQAMNQIISQNGPTRRSKK